MAYRKLTHREMNRVMWSFPSWDYPAQNTLFREFQDNNGTARINVGPRGGTSWGESRMDNRTYRAFKRRAESNGVTLVEDRDTGRVHMRVEY